MKHNNQFATFEDALKLIKSGDRVFIHGSAATPTYFLDLLAVHADKYKNVEIISISMFGNVEIAKPEYQENFRINSLFVSEPVRDAVKSGRADYIPVFLSEIPDLFRNGILALDVAIVQVSVPDEHGYVTLGTSVDIARAAVNTAKNVIAIANPQMPRTHGDGMIHTDRITAIVYHDAPIHELEQSHVHTEAEIQIGKHIAELIDDRSTLQMGIGSIPDAVLKLLTNHKDLGVHTEMFSDGIIALMEKDVITNRYKKKHPGRTVTGFCSGTRKLYDYVNDNPSFAFLDIDYVNEVHVIRQNPKVIAINSCIELDFTGQVCSDSIGNYQYSGVGGQMDFIRGAALSEGGKPIIALPSRTSKGIPRIVPFLKQGASVVTTRAHMHYVVTEFGVAYLFGKNLRQRAKSLIAIAHPDDREYLEKSYFERFGSL
ncbi:MAG TPA: acetyl-CoA hydrolase/transferase C-terminal domain-containing protein [Bacteroidia bacterium]|nr:acetyl-CoA hydrolase/transferase C-terminal domain-containing protein [Bacteroidia bacterium]